MHALNSKENFDSHGIVGESVFCTKIPKYRWKGIQSTDKRKMNHIICMTQILGVNPHQCH